MIRVKRAYEKASPDDGKRVLVERLWPRGISKSRAHIESWLKDVAPSTELRKWYAHDPKKWPEFRKRYLSELRRKSDLVRQLKTESTSSIVTLVYGAKDTEHNSAIVLKELIEHGARK